VTGTQTGESGDAGRGFGHGKVILVGEHAVVYGHTAVAAGLSAGITVTARPGSGRLRVPTWGLDARAGDGSDVGRALAALLRGLGSPDLDLDFEGDAQIPSRAGLGSSAALGVAIARAAVAATGRTGLDIGPAVAAAEAVFHGNPSGIDAAAAQSGGAGRFSRAAGWQAVPVRQAFRLCVGLSGRPRDTAAQVAAVARLRARLTVADDLLAALGRLAEDTATALALGDVDGLGRIFDAAHGVLAALRLSGPELDALVHTARAAGAIGAKLTGAGGGGAVIALAPGRAAALAGADARHDLQRQHRGQHRGGAGVLQLGARQPDVGEPAAPQQHHCHAADRERQRRARRAPHLVADPLGQPGPHRDGSARGTAAAGTSTTTTSSLGFTQPSSTRATRSTAAASSRSAAASRASRSFSCASSRLWARSAARSRRSASVRASPDRA
jgi:mevalonate kinase